MLFDPGTETSTGIIKNAVFYNDLERDCIAIVCEEAGQFMENTKTIDETIEVIQNRVQLMLDERK